MTALKEYQRLESMGVWRESPATQRRDVIVAFGDSTLVISDKSQAALSHWSLAAVARRNPGEMPALYAPGPDATETLEIEDDTMVAAIEKVRTLIARRRPQPGRLRVWLLAASVATVAGLLVFWMPGALLRHTVSVLPPATRAEIGTDLLTAIARISGRPCATERGSAALARLSSRLLGPAGGEIVVVPGGVATTAHLPGGLILANRALVEDHETPDVVAGYVLAEVLRREAADPMARLLRAVGIAATIRLLTTGAIPQERLAAYAETLLTTPPEPVADDALLARFAATRVASSPYAYAVDISGEATLALIEADPMWSGGAAPVLDDADWVSLQGICGE
jgi:hypothetical protein